MTVQLRNPQSPIHCKRCGAELAHSFGAGVIAGGVKITSDKGKPLRLECPACDWGNWFHPLQKNVAITAQTVLV